MAVVRSAEMLLFMYGLYKVGLLTVTTNSPFFLYFYTNGARVLKNVVCQRNHSIKENNDRKVRLHKMFFHKTTYISTLVFEELTQTLTTQQTTAGGDHKSPCSCAECLSAHYTVGCSVLQALHCLT